MEQDNRESWLNRVAVGMAPLFEALDTPLPDRVRVAIGFTSAGRKGKAIGECWDNRRSADGHFEIFIRPDLAHELVHAAVGIAAGHGKPFKRIALGLGLVEPMRATTPGDAFLGAVTPILAAAGPLPHARLDTGGQTTAPKKQAARMLKCECEVCGYTVRTTRKWLETAGAPLCPIEGHGPMHHDPLESDGDDSEP
ncbi:transcription elongation protein SprT [Sphingomonas sanxanigenens]|uniref:Transcription elongation protein SprT n=1 Tax=Sphingomonas sanxanigenens DSM 19645 = NX02 TaxID=1123269 RepID=A0A0F7JUE2_9SPHN|nr:transcription elongation protein SprT [Sphingomonas sanxanigenens]AKH18924.1 transcription elongation protein SprT [Sphingomonas sanxanigenens DSM 19645 = NX02]